MTRKNWLLFLAFPLIPALARSQTVPSAPPAALARPMLGAGQDPVRYVGGPTIARSGEDIGAQINAAYASLPSSGGSIVVLPDPGGHCYSFSTPIVANVPGKYLLLGGGSLNSQFVRGTSAPACLDYTPTVGTAVILDYVPAGSSNAVVTHGIQNLTLTNNQCETLGGCGSSSVGIAFGGANGGAQGATFANLRVLGFGTGLLVSRNVARLAGGVLAFRDCAISYNSTGVQDTDGDAQHLSFDACHIEGNGVGVSSNASLRISNSWINSNTFVGATCLAPAACDFNNNHFENGGADTTHFLDGNGIFFVSGGDMRDDRAVGNTDWWMHFAGVSFYILGTALATNGRTTNHVLVNEGSGVALVQNVTPNVLNTLYSNPSAIARLTWLTDPAFSVAANNPQQDGTSGPTDQRISTVQCCMNVRSDQTPEAAVSDHDFGNMLYVDGVRYKTIDDAVATLGTNPGIVVIPPTYTGPESTHLSTVAGDQIVYDGPDQITLLDLRAGTNKAYHLNFGGMVLGALSRLAVTQRKGSPISTTSAILGTNFVTGTFPSNSGTLAAITAQTTIEGNINVSASRSHVAGIEGYVSVVPTNAVKLPTDARAFTASVNIDRLTGAATIPTAVGYFASTHTNVSASGGSIMYAYGFDAAPQVNGTVRNAGYHNAGNWLTENDTAFDAVDSRGNAHHSIYWRRSNLTEFRPLEDAHGWEFLTTDGAGLFHIDSNSIVSRIAHEFPSGLSIGGGALLTNSNQSGTGSICMTTGCTLSSPFLGTPVINGMSSGSGVQGTDSKLLTSGTVSGVGNLLCTDAQGGATTVGCSLGSLTQVARSGRSCTTGNNSYDSCANVLSWPDAFADTNYSVTCSGIGPSNPRANLTVAARSASGVTVNVVTYGSVGVSFAEIDCTAVYDGVSANAASNPPTSPKSLPQPPTRPKAPSAPREPIHSDQ